MPAQLDATNKQWKMIVDKGRRVKLTEDKIALVDFGFWKRFDQTMPVLCPTATDSGEEVSSSRHPTAVLSGPNDDRGRYACVVTTPECTTQAHGAVGKGTEADPPLKTPIRVFGPGSVSRHSTQLFPAR